MNFSVQTDRVTMIKEAVKSECNTVRFGSEFCEWKIPSLETLKKGYILVKKAGKDFVYITPRVSNDCLEKIRDHFNFLNKKDEIDVVVNDFGVIKLLEGHLNLKPILGRQLIYIPARCPWKEISDHKLGILDKRRVAQIFYQTSLNYIPTISFFKGFRVQSVDLDWLPHCFSNYKFLAENGLSFSVYLHLVPITITRRCHTARFLGEKSLENCSKPCYTRSFLLKHEILGIKLILHGNTVFKFIPPSKKEIKQLYKNRVAEFIITMNSVTGIKSQKEINVLIERLRL